MMNVNAAGPSYSLIFGDDFSSFFSYQGVYVLLHVQIYGFKMFRFSIRADIYLISLWDNGKAHKLSLAGQTVLHKVHIIIIAV